MPRLRSLIFVMAIGFETMRPLSGQVGSGDALPGPQIPGFRFPEGEATVTRWVTEMTRATSPEARAAAGARIYQHGWGLWTTLTAETNQLSGNQAVRVFETWSTPDELNGSQPALPVPPPTTGTVRRDLRDPRPLNRRSSLLPLSQLIRTETPDRFEDVAAAAPAVAQIERIAGSVKFNPTAAAHLGAQGLLKLSTLDILLEGGAAQIPPFPAASLVVKPIFQIITARDLVAGRYYQLKVWPGPPDVAQPFGPAQWPGAVWIDRFDGGEGTGAIDEQPASDGSSRTPATTYPISALIHYRLSAADAIAFNAAKPGSDAQAGDIAVLVAMHVSSRELARWTWQTFWWTPNPAEPHAPSSPAIAAERPDQLRGAPRNYAMAVAYTMLSPTQPYVGGENNAPAVYAYNPWIEARLGPAEIPDSRPGFDPTGRVAANNVGVQTNCMSCHAQANYNPRHFPTAPRPTGARYVDLGAAEFVGTLQVDFLWSVARHAR